MEGMASELTSPWAFLPLLPLLPVPSTPFQMPQAALALLGGHDVQLGVLAWPGKLGGSHALFLSEIAFCPQHETTDGSE